MVSTPTTEPDSFVAGDTVTWKKTLDDYPASAGWTLTYNLRGAGSINITASASGDDHLISVAAATSAAYTAGNYKWSSFVTKSGERHNVDNGYITVEENLATATATTDRLVQLQSDITAINAFLSKNYKYSSYSIAGRSLANYPITDLFTLRDRMKRELRSLQDAEKIKQGLDTGKLVRVRFTT